MNSICTSAFCSVSPTPHFRQPGCPGQEPHCSYVHTKLPNYRCRLHEGHLGNHSLIVAPGVSPTVSNEAIIRYALVLARLKVAFNDHLSIELTHDEIADLFSVLRTLAAPTGQKTSEATMTG